MTIWNTVRKTLTSASGLGMDLLKNSPIPIPVSDTYLNKALPRVIPDSPIEDLVFTAHDGYFTVSMQINHTSGRYSATTSFGLVRANISRNDQRIVLTRKGPLLLLGHSAKTRFFASAYRAFLLAFPKYDLLKSQVSNTPGMYFNGDKWTIDLQELGFRNTLEAILKAKIQESFPTLSFLVPSATGIMFNSLAIDNISVQKGRFLVGLRYQG